MDITYPLRTSTVALILTSVESCEVSECQVKALSKRLFIIYVPSVGPPMRNERKDDANLIVF